MAERGPGRAQGPSGHGPGAGESRAFLGAAGSLSVFRLPDRPGAPLSCALTFNGLSGWEGGGDRLLSKEDFGDTARRLMREAEDAGLRLRVDLVQVDGLQAAEADGGGGGLRRRLTATLRANAYNGEGATEVAPDRFAVLRPSTASAADLDEQLRDVANGALKPVVASLALTGASVDENIRALRYALDQYIQGGAQEAALNFGAVVQKTARETAKLKSALASRAWSLVYQPVVALKDEALHHFEALARFEPGASPAPSICLAEELGLIADLDLAVARKVTEALAGQKPSIHIAANLSAASLMQPAFHKALEALTEHDLHLRPRLLLELTETHCLTDLEAADRAIQGLEAAGSSGVPGRLRRGRRFARLPAPDGGRFRQVRRPLHPRPDGRLARRGDPHGLHMVALCQRAEHRDHRGDDRDARDRPARRGHRRQPRPGLVLRQAQRRAGLSAAVRVPAGPPQRRGGRLGLTLAIAAHPSYENDAFDGACLEAS